MTLNDFKNANLACKYICVSCDFNSNNNYDYKKHIATQKHKHRINDYFSDKKTHENVYKCVCGKIYKYKQGLSNHKKKCCNKVGEILTPPHIQTEPNYTELIMKLINENQELRNTVLLENQEFKNTILLENKELRNQITEMIPKIGNNNTIKQKFNINFFLNEQCKDALTMEQFINKIEVSLSNLMLTKNKGLTEGISNIFIENMNKLSIRERPMHCTDTKRETVYIKSENIGTNPLWEKDNENIKLKHAIKKVSHKQIKHIADWVEKHPDWEDNPAELEEYMAMTKNCTDDLTEKKREEKIIKKLCNTIQLGEGEQP